MIADFNAGHDIHAATAARIFHKSIGEVTRDERRKAKTANSASSTASPPSAFRSDSAFRAAKPRS